MAIAKVLKRIWNDPVFSKIIANAIWFLPTALIGLFTQTLKIDLFEQRFSLITVIFIVFFLLFVFSLYIQIQFHRNKKKAGQYNDILSEKKRLEKKINNLIDDYDSLKEKLDKYNNFPYSSRLEMFNIGDKVKRRYEEATYDCEIFTVIRKPGNAIIAVDKKNIEQKFSPEALSTAAEFVKEELEHEQMLIKEAFKY